jgi:peptidoglycan/LPS O-acetylase OafA/YrhL
MATSVHRADDSMRIASLDGIRTVAIVLVVLAHASGTQNAWPESWLSFTGDLGILGVRIFFVLSGFLITHLLLKEEETGRISLPAFYARRCVRILPPCYFFLLVVALLTWAGVFPIHPRELWLSIVFLANTSGIAYELAHLWSLAIEEQFYLCWPLLLIFCPRRLINPLLAVILLGLPSFSVFALHGHHFRFFAAVSSLASGCLLARWADWLLTFRRMNVCLRWRGTGVVLFLLFFWLQLESQGRWSWLASPVLSVAICCWILSCASFPEQFAGRVLNWRLVADYGWRYSYPLYLWQQLFVNRYAHHWLTVFPVSVAAAATCAALSFHLVEKPVQDRFRWRHPITIPAPKHREQGTQES